MFRTAILSWKNYLTLTRAERRRATSSSSGFTLIELLTVISIMGILTAVVTVNLSSARKQARDVRRKTDVSTIQSAVELYANANNGKIPAATSPLKSSSPNPWIPGLSAYISNTPVDPTNTGVFLYTYQSGPANTPFQSSYIVDATLEAEPATNANLPPTTASATSSDQGFYVTGTYVAADSTVHYRVSSGGK
jgi:prepilin-type N-terminal cleavage/methylation domain-containing protein